VDDEKRHRNRDAGVRHIKRRPRIGVPNVQIEKEKIDHVSVQEAISQIPQNPSEQQRKREVAPPIGLAVLYEQNRHNDQRDDRNYNEESIVAPERSKRRTGIRNVHQAEEIRYDNARLKRADQSQDQLFCQLIQRVEWQGEKEDESHVRCLSFRAKRGEVEESLNLEFVAHVRTEIRDVSTSLDMTEADLRRLFGTLRY
jgi:hypothetical protein